MIYDPIAANLAVELTRHQVGSARPDAPVVSDDRIRTARTTAVRLRLASSLRAVAGWVEPRPAKVCQPG